MQFVVVKLRQDNYLKYSPSGNVSTFFSYSIDQLEALFDWSRDDAQTLDLLIGELERRSTDRAKSLKQRAIQARGVLAGRGSDSKPDRTPPGSIRRGKIIPRENQRDSQGTQPYNGASRGLEEPPKKRGINSFAMLDAAEQARLARLYAGLRERLLDLSRRNPMLNYKHQPRSKRQLQIVDEVPEEVYRQLTGAEASLDIIALPEPEDIPPDEKTEEFVSAFEHAKVSDLEYLTRVEALDATGWSDDIELAKLDRWLRDKVRAGLSLPPRPNRKTLDIHAHARQHGIDPSVELRAGT